MNDPLNGRLNSVKGYKTQGERLALELAENERKRKKIRKLLLMFVPIVVIGLIYLITYLVVYYVL